MAGAGIGGLAFAASLQLLCEEQGVKPLQIQLFERDKNAEVRAGQGYSLSVRSDSGGLQVGPGVQLIVLTPSCACSQTAFSQALRVTACGAV